MLLLGLKSEGLYRISGFSDSVEEVKMGFDKGSSCWFYRVLSTHKWHWKRLPACVCPHEAKLFRLLKNWHICGGLVHLGMHIFQLWTDLTSYKPCTALNVALLGFRCGVSENKPVLGPCCLNFNCKKKPATVDWSAEPDLHAGAHPWQSVIPAHSTVMLSLPAQVGHSLLWKACINGQKSELNRPGRW